MVLRSVKKTATVLFAQAVLLGLLPVSVLAETFRLESATVADINKAFDAGALSSEQLTQLYLNRINAYDDQGPSLNSVIIVNPNALETAAALDVERQSVGMRSPLHGIPVLIKDNYDTFDLPTTAGSLSLFGSIPPDDAFLTQKLRDAGAIILGKTNLAEFAMSGANTFSSVGGQTLNPYALDRVPAGSSGGTASAIAANFGTVGLGTDTGISIRGPASANSLVGLRPTIGLTSRDGIIPLNLARDVGGPITRTVEDAAVVLDVTAGFDPNDPVTASSIGKIPDSYTNFLDSQSLQGSRIGVLRQLIETDLSPTTPSAVRGESDPEVVALTNAAIEDMRVQGAEILEVAIPNLYELNAATSASNRFEADINNYLASLGPNTPVSSLDEIIASGKFDPSLTNSLTSAAAVENSDPESRADFQPSEAARVAYQQAVLEVMDNYELDALVYPSFKNPPRLIGDETSPYGSNGSFISPATGFPSINVPMGFTASGLPLGIQFLGRAYSEPTLLGLGFDYEQATMHRIPPTTTPPLSGETFEYEPVPEPSATIGLTLFGLTILGFKLKQQRKIKSVHRAHNVAHP